jgi:hypothetical protein
MKGLNKVNEEFAKLELAANEFKKALNKFSKTFDPETVGIGEFCEQIDEMLFEIDQEITEEFE